MRRSKRSGKCFKIKGLLLSLATVLLVFGLIGTSIAWLVTSTDPIVNVFTYGDIQIKLEETTGNRYKMTPGATLEKDPKITVLADSEDCWLFVKIDESAVEKLSDYIDYSIADGWTALDGVSGVYYREVDSSDQDVSFGVLADDQVTVKGTVTKEMLEKLNNSNYPTLTFTGYAVQRDANIEEIDTAAEAWALISNS
ncbi:MAG: hypothetical protein E7633_06205 [Ruminococcaceae bacterium]|nr:hypothetical protein [Oscillospiraceae bacterium]